MTYTSYGSFAPIYTGAIDELFNKLYPDRARQAEVILRRIAEHADSYGMCWPGIARLAKVSHYSYGTVKRSIIHLCDFDFIRFHIETSKSRRREQITWQISPRVLFIKQDYILQVEELWIDAKKGSNVIFNAQPDSESESEPDALTRTRTKTRTTSTSRSESAKSEPQPHAQKQRAAPPANEVRSNAKKSAPAHTETDSANEVRKQEQREARKQDEKQGSAPPPPPLSQCRKPLTEDAEKLARKIAEELQTHVTQSRQLILQFDMANVHNALNWLDAEQKSGRPIKSPFGLMKWWLEEHVIVDAPPAADSLSGKYSDFFER